MIHYIYQGSKIVVLVNCSCPDSGGWLTVISSSTMVTLNYDIVQ